MGGRKIGIIAAAVSIAVIVGVISVMTYNSSEPDVTNSDKVDSVQITDSATVKEPEEGFILDEDGKKVYIIEASDSPTLGDN